MLDSKNTGEAAPTVLAVGDPETPVTDEQRPEPRLLASDFYGYLKPSRCGLRVWLKEQGVEEEPAGVFREMLMRLGIEHELRHLERFPNALDIGELPRDVQREATMKAVAEGERVIYQGRMHATATIGGREIEVVGLP